MKFNTYNNKNNHSVCQVLNLNQQAEVYSWAQRVKKLAAELCSANRDVFYREYLEMSRAVATRLMKDWGWKGDVYQDAQDVASECTFVLLKQEAKGTGLFSQEKRSYTQLCGYLSQTIWLSCQQRMAQLQREMKAFVVSLEALQEEKGSELEELRDHCLSCPEKRLDLELAVKKMQQDKVSYPKLPRGVTPMDCVLDDAVAKALLQKTVPTRTLERYKKHIRETIALQMDIDLNHRKRLARQWSSKFSGKKQSGLVDGPQKQNV